MGKNIKIDIRTYVRYNRNIFHRTMCGVIASMNKLHPYYKIGIDALLPTYIKDKGDYTRIILKNGDTAYIDIKTRSALTSLSNILCVDLTRIRKKYSDLIGQKNRVPIPLSFDLILVPFKTRQPVIKNDSCLGYINFRSIECATKINSTTTELNLKSGITIEVLRSISCVKKRLAAAQLTAHHFITNSTSSKLACTYLKEYSKEYNQPATKADVAYISNKLNHIIYRLGLD
ncbi:MAG: hypothetical protein PHP06_09895 [Clostridia bacterium]|nr:hypothetical protein [Clostridia bacterium]